MFAHGRVPNWNVNMCARCYRRRIYDIVSSYLYLYLYLYLYWIWICARAVTRGEFTTLVLHICICICICIYIDCEYAQCRQLQGEGLPHWSLVGSGSEQCPPFSHHLYPHPSPPPSRLFFHLLVITNFFTMHTGRTLPHSRYSYLSKVILPVLDPSERLWLDFGSRTCCLCPMWS